jgi:hypothetical protein
MMGQNREERRRAPAMPDQLPPEALAAMMAPPPGAMPLCVGQTIEMLNWRPSVEDQGHDETGRVIRCIVAMAADNTLMVRLGGINPENAAEIARILTAPDENPPSAVASGKLVVPDGKLVVPGRG